MDSASISHELTAVKKALEKRPSPTIAGAQLSTLIHTAAPDLNVRTIVGILKGPGALTEFIRRYLSDVVERIGHLGGDPLYQIKGREAASLPTSATPQIWRTFISPNSQQHLVLSLTTRILVVRDTTALSGEGEVEVVKASPDEHDRIRADFEATLAEGTVLDLREHVSSDTDFDTWIKALKTHAPEAVRKWGQYRRHRLAELFAVRITELSLEETLQQEALKQIKASEVASYDAQKGEKPASQRPSPRSTGELDAAADADVTARRLARAAIDHLSYDELRALRIPLGAMLDAIRGEA